MAGITFLKTKNIEKIRDFYITIIGVTIWLDQKDCIIFKHDNLLFGFCDRGEADRGCLLTFFFRTKAEVDEIYEKIKDFAVTTPVINDKYQIYQFFARDLEGRDLEFQSFLHEIDFNWDNF